MAVKAGTTEAQIRFSTQIIRRLGEELNPSIDQSILELVKNSYDADAKSCTVELYSITEIGGTIKIKDDGKGMDEGDIINGWLVLGESSKSNVGRTELNRIPAGNKGLGRLAALRMGHVAALESVPKNLPEARYQLEINWDEFDRAKLVEDVFLDVTRSPTGKKILPGTTITIKNLKTRIGEREAKKIARGLILLADPFEDDPNGFKPILKSKEFQDMERLVSRRYFDDAEYHLSATVDNTGFAKAAVLDYRGQVIFEAPHKEIARRRNGQKYGCPATTFDLWVFLLNSTSFSGRHTSIGEVREWLTEFGGVHLYENGLRVNPYGNAGNDWLDMNLSRAKSPEERPSTNTSIGVVKVKDSKGLLSQKTDRSGFIENDVFHEIRSFCQDALDWMAKRRIEVAEQKRRNTRETANTAAGNTKVTLQQAIKKLSRKNRKELEKAFAKFEKAQENQLTSLRSEVQLYRTLSTAGITAATFSHESRGNPLKAITQAIKSIERRTKEHLKSKYEELFEKPVQSILRAVSSLAVLGSATLKILSHEKRRVTRVEIHEVISNVLETFQPFTDGRDIILKTELTPGKPYMRSSEAAIESILTNLLNNSLVALENSVSKSREILIQTFVEQSTLSLTVADNGPGIVGIDVNDIWLPGETTNPNGTGLGLTIVRDAVHDLGGTVSAMAHGQLGGAEIIVELPIIGK
ncbi:sensor histidine kinase [Chryseolinea sp. H1M3-3]|uniref:sensor histidine kinase n=1 Tax=Chryseolinea sp. H1M3-3 TaxID=3034144 RepID=UPI0023EBAC8D|nr:sensor histidine kinase [Chryseolinea sp. H1M3-3]